jgi:HCOMODA/2-hydroxy-3-carboxy-muconic semialdehyde decarboxylase
VTRANLGQNSPVSSPSRILAPAGPRTTAGVVRGLTSKSLGLWRALRAARRARFGPSAAALRDLVAANRILANERIVDGYGHVSARAVEHPERFFLARAMAPGLVKAGDLIEYDLDGDSVHGASRDGYVERFLHAAIYRARPDVGAIVHCHTPSLIPFADSSVPLRPMYHMSAFLALGAPVFEIRDVSSASEMLVSDARIGRALADTLGDAAVLLMRGHGAVIVGASIRVAVSRSIYLDLNAKMQAEAIALGGAVAYLEEGDMRADSVDPDDRNWAFWKQQALARRSPAREGRNAIRSPRD